MNMLPVMMADSEKFRRTRKRNRPAEALAFQDLTLLDLGELPSVARTLKARTCALFEPLNLAGC